MVEYGVERSIMIFLTNVVSDSTGKFKKKDLSIETKTPDIRFTLTNTNN